MAKRFIDADAVLSIIEHIRTKFQSKYASGQLLKDSMRYVEKKVKALPTADVAEVRHGHWIHKVKRYPYQPDDCEAVCSVCGMDYALDPEYTIKYFAMHNKFCPNCGARMDGDAE